MTESKQSIRSFSLKSIECFEKGMGEGGEQEEKTLYIKGYANSGKPDRWDEIMPKGCWDTRNFDRNPIMLYNHDHSKAIGRCTKREDTDSGLYFEAEIGRPSTFGLTKTQKEVRSLIDQKILNTLSVGFIPKDWEYKGVDGKEFLVYTKAELLEISVVTVPMDASATIDGTEIKNIAGSTAKKSKGDFPMDKKELEAMLGDVKAHTEAVITKALCAKEAIEKQLADAKAEHATEVAALKQQLADKDATIADCEAYIEECNEILSDDAGVEASTDDEEGDE